MISSDRLLGKDGVLILAYDQGLEHGPSDFNDESVDPSYVIDIAKKGRVDAIVFQKGIAKKYNVDIKDSGIPLILKLNGKTNLYKGEPISEQICSVDEAIKLGAVGVGYTIYIGSEHESAMLKEFGKIEKLAHEKGLFVVAWIYPRGKSMRRLSDRKLMAYSARVGLEIGADIVKVKFEGRVDDLRWAVDNAGKCRVVVAGGTRKDKKNFLEDVGSVRDSGAAGLAVGRNIWQDEKPLEIIKEIRKVLGG